MFEPELDWLYNTARKLPRGSIIIEIGVWKGRSSAALYEGAGLEKSVISIDTWQATPEAKDAYLEAQTTDVFQVYLENMRHLGFNPLPYVHGQLGPQYLKQDSVEAANCFDDGSVDLVFIDGDHYRCGEDIDAWFPKLKGVDSMITGHDYIDFPQYIQQEIHKRFWIHQLICSIWVHYTELRAPNWYV